jgi:hypothetical protein
MNLSDDWKLASALGFGVVRGIKLTADVGAERAGGTDDMKKRGQREKDGDWKTTADILFRWAQILWGRRRDQIDPVILTHQFAFLAHFLQLGLLAQLDAANGM